MTTSEHEYLTIAEAAALLRVSTSTVRRAISAGSVRSLKVGYRSVRIKRGDLERISTDSFPGQPWWKAYSVRLHDPSLSEEAWLKDIEEINDRILAERGGVPLPDSLPLLHEARTERDEHLASL